MAGDRGREHAFPHLHIQGGVIRIEGGLSKRELIAAMAMQGILTAHYSQRPSQWDAPDTVIAEVAIQHADALLVALSKEPSDGKAN